MGDFKYDLWANLCTLMYTIIPCNLPITLQQTIIHSCKVIINVLCSEYLCSWKVLIYQRRGKEMKTERKRRGNQTWVIYHLNYWRDKPKPNYFRQTFSLHSLLLFQHHCHLQGNNDWDWNTVRAYARCLSLLWLVWQSGAALEPNAIIQCLDLHTTGRFNPIP